MRGQLDPLAVQVLVDADPQPGVLGIDIAHIGHQGEAGHHLEHAFKFRAARTDRRIRAHVVRRDRAAVGIGGHLDLLPVVRGDVEQRTADVATAAGQRSTLALTTSRCAAARLKPPGM
ncbi:hypothetical protein G6F58_013340 [Rhizopus delemar]|nr:hypothetical protein G6F58_013340 [Rhizopus delemar]